MMEICIVNEKQFTAWVNGRKHVYAVAAQHTDENTDVTYIMYIEEAQLEAGELQLQMGRLAELEGRTHLLEDDGKSPDAQRLLEGLQRSIDTGVMAPVVLEAMAEDGLADEAREEPGEYPPEEEYPEPDATPEERLLYAIFGEPLPDGLSPITEEERMGRLILELDADSAFPEDE